ncbi:hypothetical protein EIP86_006625 [Pleurotus ostreatoroseus]|nr:hypothetical protein EIP86_006625 [Pleurotus ostreatoroseus]
MNVYLKVLLLYATVGLFQSLPWYASAALLALLGSIAFGLYHASDPYGTFHLQLNVTDPAQGSQPPTEWLNMGYWKNAASFPDACEALALKVIRAAGCAPGGRVLGMFCVYFRADLIPPALRVSDVGHGSGDSLLLQLQHPSVPRPSELVGITSIYGHFESSRLRTSKIDSPVRVSLHYGDAVYRPDISVPEHPLNPSASTPGYDSIIAVDCAYHFSTRQEFLRQSFARLAPGGRIALADLCFDRENAPAATVVTLVRMMPKENAINRAVYVREMEKIGYTDVHLEDISDDVFPGFIQFLWSRGIGWKMFAMLIQTLSRSGLRFVVVSGRKPL